MRVVEAQVLVVGCGPAGSAAARTLAARGCDVVLVDRSRFARDKVCGDALIPDALRALARLGLESRVRAEAAKLDAVRVHSPNGSSLALDADVACLPRHRLDDLMRLAAVESGARFLAPYRLSQPIERDGYVDGAAFEATDGEARLRVDARFTVLATGAATDPLEAFGVCERKSASAVAARIYLQVPETLAREHRDLCISYERAICPGYGWIFPGPRGVFNVGVGYFNDAAPPPTRNLRKLLARFLETFAPARALVERSRRLTDVRGAPLRTALQGAKLARPGLLVVGEAAGLTYSLTGEGIGKAIESGILAGELIAGALADGADGRAVADAYAAKLDAAFAQRFYAYSLAQRWIAKPAVADFVAWRANRGERVRRQLEALLCETEDPRVLFSVTGMLKSFLA